MTIYNDKFVSIERLREVLSYSSETGCLTWKVSSGKAKVGAAAGKVTNEGYIRVGIDRVYLSAHRIAWALHHGEWPTSDLDHVNRVKSDNRMANLRPASPAENNANRGMMRTNTHGAKGVTRLPSGKWQAQIQANGKNHYLGSFSEKHEATVAYNTAAQQLFGAYAASGVAP